jgi:dissimilatory sulfite reductase (desulfoviridin) alpha/beta subunit
MYLWKWTGKVDQERRLHDVIHKVGNRKYYQEEEEEEEEEKNEFSGGTLSPW